MKLIEEKEKSFYKEKFKENNGKSKELWKAPKSLGNLKQKVQSQTFS